MAAYNPDGQKATLIFKLAMTVDSGLHIRHVTSLVLHGLRWLVTYQTVGDPLPGRPLLDALGHNTRNILAAAASKHSGAVDLSTLLLSNTESDRNGRVSGGLDGLYHSQCGSDETYLDADGGWLDLGPGDMDEKNLS